MGKYEEKELDGALSILNKNGIMTPIQYTSEDEKIKLDGVFRHLEALGFVKLYEAGYITAVLLLPKGLAFVNNGGFHDKKIQEDKDKYIKNLQTKNLELSNINLKLSSENLKYEKSIRFWKIVSLGLTIGGSLITYFGFFQ